MENQDWHDLYIRLERKTILLERHLDIKTRENERLKITIKKLNAGGVKWTKTG